MIWNIRGGYRISEGGGGGCGPGGGGYSVWKRVPTVD